MTALGPSRRLPLLLLIGVCGAYVLPTTALANPRPTGSARVVIAESPCACPAPKGWDVSVPTLAAGLGTGYKLWRALPPHWKTSVLATSANFGPPVVVVSLLGERGGRALVAFLRDLLATVARFFS